MRFATEDTNTKTAYNCRQFPYLKFKWQNAKKNAFCNRGHEYRNYLTVSVF